MSVVSYPVSISSPVVSCPVSLASPVVSCPVPLVSSRLVSCSPRSSVTPILPVSSGYFSQSCPVYSAVPAMSSPAIPVNVSCFTPPIVSTSSASDFSMSSLSAPVLNSRTTSCSISRPCRDSLCSQSDNLFIGSSDHPVIPAQSRPRTKTLFSRGRSDWNLRNKLANIAKPALRILLSIITEIDLALRREDLTWEDGLHLARLHEADPGFINAVKTPRRSSLRQRQAVAPDYELNEPDPRNVLVKRREPDYFATPSTVQTCNYCLKRGHVRSVCRKLHGLCWGCGSTSHLIAQCPVK